MQLKLVPLTISAVRSCGRQNSGDRIGGTTLLDDEQLVHKVLLYQNSPLLRTCAISGMIATSAAWWVREAREEAKSVEKRSGRI